MPVVRGIRLLNAISSGNTTPSCLDTLLSDGARLSDVTTVLQSPQYACQFGQSNNASYIAMRSNNAMTALFSNPVGSCVFYQTPTSRNNMLASSCYYNYMMGFGSQPAIDAFTHFGNTTCMMDCAFNSCTAFLSQATSSNTDITKMLTCNCSVRLCFIGKAQSKQEALGTPGRPAFWLSDTCAFGYLTCCMLDTAFANSVFLETLNRDIACVMCTPSFNCCAWGTAAGANTYINNACAINEVVNKGACCLNFTSCNFSCWYSSTYGYNCMLTKLASGNTYFMDQINALNSFRQKSCLFYLYECKECYSSCINSTPGATKAYQAQCLIKTELIVRGGALTQNNSIQAMSAILNCRGQRICPMTIANGCQLSNTEIEYLGKFSKCNYNVITHADSYFTLISPGFWNSSSMIACFRNCYCCSIDRTTANTSGLTLNCSLYYTTDNAATFNRLCIPLPACIFQQVCGNCCCQFTVRYGLSSFACCNYVYTGWIISDCGTGFGGCCTPAYFKTGHSRVCLFANSQPNTASWTHFPDVPLPFYTITFCDEYFAGVSPMRTDGYQSTLGLCNQICCQCTGQYALMFSFGKVGDCVRISCDNFVNCVPTGLACFTPATCCIACKSLPAVTHCNFGTCYEDYFQGHGQGIQPYCIYDPYQSAPNTCGPMQFAPQSAAVSYTLIYKNSANTADSKAFLAGWRSYAMLYGGTVGVSSGPAYSCAMVPSRDNWNYYYNCNICGPLSRGEGSPYGCGYFRNSPGLNVWCYGSQANNTMIGSEIVCDAIGGSSSAWTSFSFGNVRMIGNKLVISGTMGPRILMCCIGASSDYITNYSTRNGMDYVAAMSGEHGCQGPLSQLGHVTVFNADGVVGTTVCCLDIFHSAPFYPGFEGNIYCQVACCSYCSGRLCCGPAPCQGYALGNYTVACPFDSNSAGLKTLNVYGTANSILSFPVVPNVAVIGRTPPQCDGLSWCCCGAYPLCIATCFDSPAFSCCSGLNSIFRSDQSLYCAMSYETCNEIFYTNSGCRVWPCSCILSHFCNPGSNVIVTHIKSHMYQYFGGGSPGSHQAIYTAPTANQDMTAYNFCYIISPNMDWCISCSGWVCYNAGCESTCPCCNLVCCTVSGVCICDLMCRATFPRAQQFYHDYSTYPCCSSPARVCCSAIAGCGGVGNHHLVVAQANNTWQCSSAISVSSMYKECPTACYSPCCYCNSYSTWFYMTTPPSLKTCNQSGGGNCMWYDFIPQFTNHNASYYPGFMDSSNCTWFNSQFMGAHCMATSQSQLCCYGLPTGDDAKRGGFTCLNWSLCCTFSVDSQCFPIKFSRMTRGAGGVSNVSNSLHVAYFDLVPYRCTVSGGSGFYANGNACPGTSGLTCCLMYVKSDIFYNTFS